MSNEELVQQIQQGIDKGNNMTMLYMQNKGFIASVVKRYSYVCQSSYNSVSIIEFDELMNEGYFGLVEAVNRYDPDQGVLFLSYAAHWIRQVVKRYIENCGRVMRVPVHKQEKIYKYNQVTAYCLQHFNREPTIQEYARSLELSVKAIEGLQKFMFQDHIKSLDAPLPGGEGESITIADSLASVENIENDVIEKVAKEQLQEELWDIVDSVLKNDKMKEVIYHRFVDDLTLECIGGKMNITREMVRQYEAKSIRVLRNNSRTRRLGVELGLWDIDKPMNIDRVKIWATRGHIKYLDDKELKYARRMGWIQDELYRY